MNIFSGERKILLTGITLLLILFDSCSSNKTVSSFGKRRYTKGFFLFNRKGAESPPVGRDTAVKKKQVVNNDSVIHHKRNDSIVQNEQKIEEQKSLHKKEKKAQEELIASQKKHDKEKHDTASVHHRKKEHEKKPKPPDGFTLTIIVLIVVLTGLLLFITGLVTPFFLLEITQNFMIITGIVMMLIGFLFSFNIKLGVNLKSPANNPSGTEPGSKVYNLGKPAWILALIAALPEIFVFIVIKSHLVSNLLFAELAGIGFFASGAIIAVSLMLAFTAIYAIDRHKKLGYIALGLDILLIVLGFFYFL